MIIMEAGTTGVETIVFGDILENVKRNESGNILRETIHRWVQPQQQLNPSPFHRILQPLCRGKSSGHF